ncbi:MAG: DUF3089 domain-containing protein [Lachnospiraceae bacterium]|jgi:hypothetical protein|nr:DUF3089 domain-containing protein [Lachnospiraceae bacterium]
MSTTQFWLNLPDKPCKKVDTFFIYPTVYYGDEDYPKINDPDMLGNALNLKFAHEGIFDSTNFYAPFYRQASLNLLLNCGATGFECIDETVSKYPLEDCKKAFSWYLENCNHNRPIIFASHSQGTIIMRLLLLWIKETYPCVLKRTIAAYMIGWSITPDYIKKLGLPFAKSSNDTGVVISYNTMSKDAAYNPFLQENALSINPINWRRDSKYASKEENLGSYIRFGNDLPVWKNNFADAWIDTSNSGLRTTADIQSEEPWPEGVLHRYDYDLFYKNLRENIKERIKAYGCIC